MKRRLLCFVLIIAVVLLSQSCTFSIYDSIIERSVGDIGGGRVEISEIMKELNAERRAAFDEPFRFDGIDEYTVCDESLYSLLTKEEIAVLIGETEISPSKVLLYEDAAYDVDLYFRLLKYCYGPYYYFGGDEAFLPAKEKVLKKLKWTSVITKDTIKSAIKESLGFVKDGHLEFDSKCTIGYHVCWYAKDQQFLRDDNGFFKFIDGEKWYFVEFSDERVSMELFLNDAGEIVYNPVISIKEGFFAPSCFVTIEHDGETISQTVSMKKTGYYHLPDRIDYNYLSENGITYISVRSFGYEYDDIMQTFAESGAAARGSKCIIIDIRGNNGGWEKYSSEWIKNFTGIKPSVMQYKIVRKAVWDYLSGIATLDDEYWDYYESINYLTATDKCAGQIIKNDIPVFVLVDSNTASAGEYAIEYFKTLENAVIVGDFSFGAVLSSQKRFTLPHSGIEVSVGIRMNFFNNSIENIDGIGIKPDIFCDSAYSLSLVLKMMENYGIADTSELDEIATYSRGK